MKIVPLYNCTSIDANAIDILDNNAFNAFIKSETVSGKRIISLFGLQSATKQPSDIEIIAIIGSDSESRLTAVKTMTKNSSYKSLTVEIPEAHLFEREIAEQFSITPIDHPYLKPVRHTVGAPVANHFFRLEGDAVHEVAVGPVHAGIIEPGHFRFQCHGETVHNLEISLGYQHRGVEKRLFGGPDNKTLHYMETLAGDTTIGHTTAYCETVEALSRTIIPFRAQAIRGIALELERLANHIGDLGALANDIAFLPTASYCGRIRGDLLNMTAIICGNRFGRNLIVPGGLLHDLQPSKIHELRTKLDTAAADAYNAIELLFNSGTVMDFFSGCGTISQKTARELGFVGIAARACGIERDVRFDYPFGIYRMAQIPISICDSGDVFARAFVRWMEIRRSVSFIREILDSMPGGDIFTPCNSLKPDQLAVSLIEGWRGEIAHIALTNQYGKLSRYKITDPSFHNWTALSMALKKEQISNFPVNNKSFNLSYCGFDL